MTPLRNLKEWILNSTEHLATYEILEKIEQLMPEERDGIILHDTISNDVVELDSVEDAIQYVRDNYTEGNTLHPDFISFDLLKSIGSVDAVLEDEICTDIIITQKYGDNGSK